MHVDGIPGAANKGHRLKKLRVCVCVCVCVCVVVVVVSPTQNSPVSSQGGKAEAM